jgi:cytochrome c oxidase subunit 1
MIFAIFSGLIGTGLSILIRLELAGPNAQIMYGNGQLFNVIVTAHAVFMIFFMVMPMSVGFFGILNLIIVSDIYINTNY